MPARSPARVVFLNHNRVDAGTYFRCLRLAVPLAASGRVTVEIICAGREDWTLRTRRFEAAPGVTVTATPNFPPALGYAGILLRAVWVSLLLLFRRPRPDFVHAFALAWPSVALPALVARWLLRIPLAADWDDLWGDGYASLLSRSANALVKAAEENLPSLLRVDFMTVVSRELRGRAVLRAGVAPGRVRLVRNGCDPDHTRPRDPRAARERLGIPQDVPLVVSIGHTYTPESLSFLVRAMRPVCAARPRVRLVLVGDFTKRGRFGDLITDVLRESGLGGQLVVTGEIPFQSVLDYMSAASVLALPMDDTAIDRCRSPIRLGDYLAVGGLIVSNAVGEVRDVLETFDVGLRSPPLDEAAFARNVAFALDDPEFRREAGRRARLVAERHHAWVHCARELALAYGEYWGLDASLPVVEPAEPLPMPDAVEHEPDPVAMALDARPGS